EDRETGFGDLDGGAEDKHRLLLDAIQLERELLGGLKAESTVIDTSQLRPAQLRAWLADLVGPNAGSKLTLVFESFAFKHGVASDADFGFDVRVLSDPYYDCEMRPLTSRDVLVAGYLAAQPEVGMMLGQIGGFLSRWLPHFAADQRSYLTVA
ncbi:RapZ C-terminal domain-containing protein, partial [Escherichia coli]|uniref:RapZ C-terminal domain-containing protein n=1 Tax=Escherichia coli TaxID=562 RepID=UPI0023EE2F96